MSGQTPTTGITRFVAYTSEDATETVTTSITRANTISAASEETLRSNESTVYALITTISDETEPLTDATLTTTAEKSRLSTNQATRITEATSKVLSTTHSEASTTQKPYVETNASIRPASSYVSTSSSVDATGVTSTARLGGNTTATGQILGWKPVHFGLILGGVGLLILVLVVALILFTQRRKKLKRKKISGSDAWISRPGSSGVALTDLTFNPPLDLEKAIVDGDISTLDGLANAPAVNIFATHGSFEADASPSQTRVNRRATLNSRKQSDGGSTPEKKGKGLTPAEIPVVSTSPSIGGASPKSEARSSTSFGSPSNSGADSASTANTDTPSLRSDGSPRAAPLPPDASASPPAAPAPVDQTTVSPPTPEPAAPRLQTDLTAL